MTERTETTDFSLSDVPHLLRDYALADVQHMTLPSLRTRVEMAAAEEIEQLRIQVLRLEGYVMEKNRWIKKAREALGGTE